MVITNPTGLHARPAVKLARLAAGFDADIEIRADEAGEWVRARSTARVMKLKAGARSVIHLRAEGAQADAALSALVDFVRRDFDEGPAAAPPDAAGGLNDDARDDTGEDTSEGAGGSGTAVEETAGGRTSEPAVERCIGKATAVEEKATGRTISAVVASPGLAIGVLHVLAESRGLARKADGLPWGHGGPIRGSGGSAPGGGGSAREAGGLTPGAGGSASGSGGFTLEAGGTTPDADGSALEAGGPIPGISGLDPDAGSLAPESGGPARDTGDPEVERAALDRAVARSLAELRELVHGSDELAADVIGFQIGLLEDDEFLDPVRAEIEAGTAAVRSWTRRLAGEISDYESAPTGYLRERAADLRDLRDRVAVALGGETCRSSGRPEHGPPGHDRTEHGPPGDGLSDHGFGEGLPGHGPSSHDRPEHPPPGSRTPGHGLPGHGSTGHDWSEHGPPGQDPSGDDLPGHGPLGHDRPEPDPADDGLSDHGPFGEGFPGHGRSSHDRPEHPPPGSRPPGHGLPDRCLVIADELTPSRFLEIDWSRAAGAATYSGSPASHVAMLARAQGVPMLVQLSGGPGGLIEGTEAILDAERGRLVPAPPPPIRERYARRIDEQRARKREALRHLSRPARTRDGSPVRVLVNVDAPACLDRLDPAHCDGIGLTRTEFLFHGAEALPGEDAQLHFYRRLAGWAGGRPVTVRTLDAGGDKPIPGLTPEGESNPFLGLRGVRLSLARPKVLARQLRALARAAAGGGLRVMLPMVTTPDELHEVRRLLAREVEALQAAGIEAAAPPLGMMVEVPAAALTIETFDADFFSIGTNDLTQYVLAAGRDSTAVADLLDPLHPAVLELIARVAGHGARSGREVSVCGEMATRPEGLRALLDAGVRTFSVPPPALASTKATLAGL